MSRPPRAECSCPQATLSDLRHRARPAVLAPKHPGAPAARRPRVDRGPAVEQSLSDPLLAPARTASGAPRGGPREAACHRAARRQTRQPPGRQSRRRRVQARLTTRRRQLISSSEPRRRQPARGADTRREAARPFARPGERSRPAAD